MRIFVIAFLIIFMVLKITPNAMPIFLNNETKEKNEAFEACTSLRKKAPYLNLKCEKLQEKPRKIEDATKTNVKLLSIEDESTRKVNKIQELKLRKLLEKLYSENVLKKD